MCLSQFLCRATPTLIGAAILVASVSAAHAEIVTDPANDFVSTYLGPHNGDMDARSSNVMFNPTNNTFTFTGTVNGNVGTTIGTAQFPAAWVWGLDRGKGTERLLPTTGAGVKFDSVIALFANQTGAFVDLLPAQPVTTLLSPGSVHVSGNTISATVPLSVIPSEGFAARHYTWNFWPESLLAQPSYVSDFAPDARNATLTIVPEPSSALLVFAGLAAAAALGMRRKNDLA